MVWVAFAGVVLQVVGLLVALGGVRSTYRTIFDRSILSDLRMDIAEWWWRLVRRPRRATVVGAGAASATAMAGRAFGQVRPADPGAGAPTSEQVAYIRRYVEILADEITQSRHHAARELDAAERRMTERLATVDEAITDTRSRLRTIADGVLGSDGRGLRWAAVGLAMTLTGVAMTAAGLPW